MSKHLLELDSDIKKMEEAIELRTTQLETPSKEKNEEEVNDEVVLDDDPQLPQDIEDPSEEVEDLDINVDDPDISQETKDQKKKYTDWKKRYKTLRSHHDATVFDLRQELSKTKSDLASLNKQYYDLSKEIEVYRTEKDDNELFSEDEVGALGEEAIKALRKGVKHAVDPIKKQLDDERRRGMEADTERAKQLETLNRNDFISRFSELVPSYVKIDKDPAFLKYMNLIDPASGYIRSDLFRKAVNSGDVERAADFYKNYLAKVSPLANKVTPTGQGGPTITTQSTKEIISERFINQFYDDVNRGRYKGRRELMLEIEAKIDKAVTERRVQR